MLFRGDGERLLYSLLACNNGNSLLLGVFPRGGELHQQATEALTEEAMTQRRDIIGIISRHWEARRPSRQAKISAFVRHSHRCNSTVTSSPATDSINIIFQQCPDVMASRVSDHGGNGN